MVDVPRLDGYHFYKQSWGSYEELYDSFGWEIPERFNIADYACDRWADDKHRVALFAENGDGETETYTFWQLRNATNRLANVLREHGVERGDRVGVNTPQRPVTVISHLAIWKLGAVTVPLSNLFGEEGMRYRLDDCEASACIVDESNIATVRAVAEDVGSLETILTIGDDNTRDGDVDFWSVVADADRGFENVATRSSDDAIIAYTSGTTGDPKGVRHAHRIMLAHLPFFNMYTNLELSSADVVWSPPELAWLGNLFALVFPPLYFGRPLVLYEEGGPFDPEAGFDILARYGVTVTLLTPTLLRLLQQVEDPAARYDVSDVRVVLSGGEEVGDDLKAWIDDVFAGAVVHEAYGQTEANAIISECEAIGVKREGTMGKPVPGQPVQLVDPETTEPIVETGEIGEIAVRYDGNPICMTEYLNLPEKTDRKIRNGWLLLEDLGTVDADGYYSYFSRKDDVIISSGRRLGPAEIENCLASHEAVVNAGVIGVPDEQRGEVPVAYVELVDGVTGSPELTAKLQQLAKRRLAEYEYPHEIEYVDALPMTVTQKVRRAALRERRGLQ